MKILLPIRHSLGLSQRKIALRIYHESGHSITRGYLSLIERGKAKPPAWLLTWMQQYSAEPLTISILPCPSCGGVHAVADCHGQPGAPAWRKPRHRCTSIHDDWLERYRERTPATEQGPMSEDIDELYVPWDMVYSSSDLRQAIAHARDKLARARKESPSWPVEAREVEGFLSGFLRGSPATAQVNTRPGMAATFGLVLEE